MGEGECVFGKEGEKVMLGTYVMKGMETKLLTTQNNLLSQLLLASGIF